MLTREKKLELLALLDEKQARADKARASSDFEYFAHTRLHIRTKSGKLERFALNKPQRYLHAKLEEQREKTGRVRALVLKARQQGASTYIGGRFYWKTSHTRGYQCFILTHEQPATDNLFKMVDRYYENDPHHPSTTAANAKELYFNVLDSGYSVGTAGTKSVGRSKTIQLLHGCLGVDTPIIDARLDKLRPMRDFSVGDLVKTHTGANAPISFISRQMKRANRVLMKGMQDFPLLATDEHRFWTPRGWTELGRLTVGDTIGFPVPKINQSFGSWDYRLADSYRPQGGGSREVGPDKIEPSYDLGRVLGLFLAEGCVLKQSASKMPSAVCFTVHEQEVERTVAWLQPLRTLFRSVKVNPRTSSKTVTVVVYGRSFATFVLGLCGELDAKRLPDGWATCGEDFARGIVHGYLSGDGHSEVATRRISAPSIRSAITIGIRDVVAALGYGWASITHKAAAVRYGRNEREAWILRLTGAGVDVLAKELGWPTAPRQRNNQTATKIFDGYAWVPICKIEDAGPVEVMDFEIDHDDHSYCTIQGATHNSEVAFWPNASGHFASVVQGVPDLEDTEIILESTANGIGGEFHERWQQAEAGIGDYIAIFIPWFWSDEYARPQPFGFTLTDEEEEYRALYDLSLEQMVWRRAKLEELKDPQLFKQEFPATAAEAFQTTGHDSFISTEHVMSARKREVEGVGPLILGVDPARFGDDGFSLAWRRGREVKKVERRHKLDAVAGAHWIKQVIDDDAPERVFVDAGGIGGPVVDILHSWGAPYSKVVVPVDFGGAPTEPARIGSDGRALPGPLNRRAEMWRFSKDWLNTEGGVSIPDDDALHADACAPGYRYNMNQKLVLESKEDIRKRGLRSPDGWDSVALTFAAPVKVRIEEPPRTRYVGSTRRRASAWAV